MLVIYDFIQFYSFFILGIKESYTDLVRLISLTNFEYLLVLYNIFISDRILLLAEYFIVC